jgi:hypothetical protein
MVFSLNQETKICNISHLFLLNYFLYKEKHLLCNVFRPHPVCDLTDNVVIKEHFDEMNKQRNVLLEEIMKIEDKKTICDKYDLEKLYRMKENYEDHLYHLSVAMSKKILKKKQIETHLYEKNHTKEIEKTDEDYHFIVSEDIQ